MSREPEEPIKKQIVAPSATEPKVTRDAQVSSKDATQTNTQHDSKEISKPKTSSPTKEKKSVKKLLGMFEQQNPCDQDGGTSSSSADERAGRVAGGGKKTMDRDRLTMSESTDQNLLCLKLN